MNGGGASDQTRNAWTNLVSFSVRGKQEKLLADLKILDGRDNDQRAKLIADRLQEWKSLTSG